MSEKPFHLGWFTNFTPPEWEGPWASGEGNDWTGNFYVEMARTLERACFDMLIIEDTSMVPNIYRGSSDFYLKHAIMVPKKSFSRFLGTIHAALNSRVTGCAPRRFRSDYYPTRKFAT